tara:strand:+ start:77 stop:670 length:594 start_codon:yes stop_codon:yes gene_type:complete
MHCKDLPEVLNPLKEIPCDKYFVNYYTANQAYKFGRDFFLNNEEYTHLIILTVDMIATKEGFEALMKHDPNYDIISGVMNVDMDKNKDKLAITKEIPSEEPKGREYNWIPRQNYSELTKVNFIGFSFTRMTRKAVEMIPFRPDSNGSAHDVTFAHDCKKNNIQIYADTGIFFKHLRYKGELLVGKKPKSCEWHKWLK